MSRKHILFANTQFTCAKYFPSAIQILTSGSDRKINYYEVSVNIPKLGNNFNHFLPFRVIMVI